MKRTSELHHHVRWHPGEAVDEIWTLFRKDMSEREARDAFAYVARKMLLRVRPGLSRKLRST